MGSRMPSLKILSCGVLHLIILALLVGTSQARGRDPKKRDESSPAPTPLVTTDGTILSLSASERRGGRVVTSIITTHILVTLPYHTSELPSSLAPQPVTSSPSNSLSTIRDPKSSPKQPWNTTAINTAGSPSFTTQNVPTGDSASSTSLFNGTTTAINIGISATAPNWNSSTLRSAYSSTPPGGNTTVTAPIIPALSGTSSFTSLQANGSTEARSTSFRVTNGGATSPLDSTQGSQSKSGENGSSTSALQTSLSEGGTAQTTRVTTSPGQFGTSSANSHAVGSPSASTQVTDKGQSFSSSAVEDTTIAGLPPTSASGSGNNDDKSTTASPGSTRVSGATSSSTASTTRQPVSPTPTAEPASSGSSGPVFTSSSTSSEIQEYATVLMAATSSPPQGIDSTTIVTWTSTEVTKTTTRDGIAWPTIFPVWFCGGGQLLCPPKCLIPFLSCGGLNLPGPVGFSWAKPPPYKPRGQPRKVRPDDPTDPEGPEDDPEETPTETPTSATSSEASCTATTIVSPNCDQHCFVSPVTTSGSTTSFTTTCNTATCKPTVVCSKTLDTTTTTTFTTHSATPTPAEHFCGDRESPCLDCANKPRGGKGLVARQHGFIPWNPAPDAALLDGPQGLTRPDVWPEGPQNWWDRMWKYVYHYCDGLTAPRVTLDGERLEMGYSTMHADVFGDKPLAGATGPFWGCSGIIIITKRGIYTSHVWEIPNFHKGTHKPTAFDWGAEFDEGILQFLKRGSGTRIGGYKGIEQLKQETPIFDNIAQDTLAVILHVPSSMTFAGSSQIPPNYGGFDPRHAALVDRWASFIADDLGFPRDKIRKNIYVKGPSYWPAYVQERNPLNPMDMYSPPYGLLHWQYHPAHVVETTADGAEVRRPTIRVWYEKFLVFEESWCPPGTVAARDDGGAGSCPMPSAPGQSSPAASDGAASASGPVSASHSGYASASASANFSIPISASASASVSGSAPGSASGLGSASASGPASGHASGYPSGSAYASASASIPTFSSSGQGSSSSSADSRASSSSTQASAGSPDTRTTSNGATLGVSPSAPSIRPSTLSSPEEESSSSKRKVTVWRTATAEVTVTSWTKPTSTAAANIPGAAPDAPGISRVLPLTKRSSPSHAPSKRLVRITQEMAFVGDEANHTAIVTVYDISRGKETILARERNNRGGGPVDLPSQLTVEDQDGSRLDVKFTRGMPQVELKSSRRGRTKSWTLMSTKDEENPDEAYCEVLSVTAGEGVLKRSVDCFYNN